MKDLRKKQGQKFEKLVSEYLGWDTVSGSGARFHPGDLTCEQWLGECKSHVNAQDRIVFNLSVWNKISTEAMSLFKKPAYFVNDGSLDVKSTWVMFRIQELPEHIMMKMDNDSIKSLSFSNSEMLSALDHVKSMRKPNPIVISSKLESYQVYVANLVDFKSILEGF